MSSFSNENLMSQKPHWSQAGQRDWGSWSSQLHTCFAFNDPMKNHYFFFTMRKSNSEGVRYSSQVAQLVSSQDWNPGLSDFLCAISALKVITSLPLFKGSAHECLLSCSSVLDTLLVGIKC